MIAAIDADSIIYIIGWSLKDNNKEELGILDLVHFKCDSTLQYILQGAKADKYIGVFSASRSFRNNEYLVANYKGTRPQKPEFVIEWEKVIKDYFRDKYGFITFDNLEADDIVIACKEMFADVTICSPDKDLKQVAGTIFDYRMNKIIEVSESEAMVNLYRQLLTGDTSDNVKGVPGLGEVKVNKLFEGLSDPIEFGTVVREQYIKYYGEYYGLLIEAQTFKTIKMVDSTHPNYPRFKEELECIKFNIKDAPIYESNVDEHFLQELGW